MAQMDCCGVNDYKDFERSENWTTYKHNRTIPEACCVLSDAAKFTPRDSSCPSRPTDQNSHWKIVSFIYFCTYLCTIFKMASNRPP